MLPENSLKISVVIPVYNGGTDFKTCLQCLAGADPAPDEIIVVADNCTDDSARVAKSFGVRLIQTDHPVGSAGARNRGAAVARGDILLFIDADVAVPKDIIARITSLFHNDSNLSAVFGSYDDAPDKQNFLSQYKNLFHHFVHQTAENKAVTFWAACGAVKREVFNRLQGFDEVFFRSKGKLRAGTIEDIDLGYRLTHAGYHVQLAKQMTVKHLKRWRLSTLVYTDVFLRALPWTRLILRDRFFPSTLNLKRSNRTSIAAIFLALVAFCWGPFAGIGYVLGTALMLAVTLLNLDLYRFFKNHKGWLFACAVVPWHWFYLFYSGASFVCGTLVYLFQSAVVSYQKALRKHEHWFLSVLLVLALFATLKLGTEFWRLLFDNSAVGAIDLHMRHAEVQQWFAGQALRYPVYPPASYILLWPLCDWLNFMAVRWLFALLTVMMAAAVVWALIRAGRAETFRECSFVALLLLSMNATGVTIGNGQLGLLVLFFLVTGLSILQYRPDKWFWDAAGAACFLISLVKPTLAAPFFWIVLFRTRCLRPSLLIICGYTGLTLWGAMFQEAGVVELMQTWLSKSIQAAAHASVHRGHSNLHSWLALVGLNQANSIVSLVLLAALGVWTFVYRQTSLWTQMGLCAMVALIWTHHGLYDDIMMIFSLVVLFRVIKTENVNPILRGSALVLLTAASGVMLLPARMFQFWHHPWPLVYEALHSLTRLAILVFLLKYAGYEKRNRFPDGRFG